ncbi:MAG: phenylalanine--tRNA ligase subunit alpha [Methanothrix sp.]|jgi:phenylalanyl-tRNA synthetase alpha chain|nr:phenylalanine--tRNA ligase subunit alpha [Methanothrix sp.]
MLSKNDEKVLEAISEGDSDPQSIADKLGMKVEAVRASADALGEQDLIKVTKSVAEIVSLTEEGTKYAKEGLPERNLLQSLGSGKPISELKDPALKIGLGWLRKKNWATIQGGVIKPLDSATMGLDEVMLQDLLAGAKNIADLHKKSLADLKSRALVASSKSKEWRYVITGSGRSLAESNKKYSESSTAFGYSNISYLEKVTSEVIKNGIWDGKYVTIDGNRYEFRPYDVTLAADRIIPGKKHPYQRLIDFMREIMLEMGFVEIKGQIVQSSFWNFDALFQPQDHPAREMQDTFYLDSLADIPDYSRVKEMHECGGAGSAGWGGCWKPEVARQEVLRTHTTGVTIKYLAEHPEPPVKAFGIDRVYRREAIDATHTPEFEQLEGIVMDRDVTFSHLLGILKEFYAKMGFEEVRFRPGYFPYTEPSVEPEVFIEGLGWVELGGAGVFRKEVTAPFGIEHPVLAWGLGVSRVAMLKLGLKDLRLLYQSDIEWLRETPVSIKL